MKYTIYILLICSSLSFNSCTDTSRQSIIKANPPNLTLPREEQQLTGKGQQGKLNPNSPGTRGTVQQLIDDSPQEDGLPKGWESHISDSSIPTDPSVPMPDLHVSHGPGRQIRYDSTSPSAFFIRYVGPVAPGRYRIEGRVEVDGNKARARVAFDNATISEVSGPQGGKSFSKEVVSNQDQFPLTIRVEGAGKHFGTIKDVRITPIAP